MSATPEIPAGLRRAFFEVLAPLALVAPVPLLWTDGASPFALVLYGCALLFLWRRARGGRPTRLSNTALNVLGLGYLFWLGFEVLTLRHGLLRSVSHLLLFTAIAKLASLKRPGEVRTALLVIFLITVASASSSTHVSSLLYFGAMAFLGFRTLARLAVLADFADAPPERVLRSVPTGGMAAAAVLIGAVITGPLFYTLPRLRRPFATAPFRVGDDAFSTTLSADRVDLESFGSAKRSNQIVLRMEVDPQSALPRVLRLREAVFTEYSRGVWTRQGGARTRVPAAERLPLETRAQQLLIGQLSIDLNVSAEGFLFLPYGAEGLQVERDFATPLRDGMVRLSGGARSVRYAAAVRGVAPRGVGASVIDPRSVPPEIRDYAEKLTAGLTEPMEIYSRIRDNFARSFVYTLTPPRGRGDPLVNFLLRSKAGHCEFFASAAAMMLTARGVPSRLVTGSYGGEVGLLSSALVVRGTNLHAWVEADIDGKGFTVFDPTPDAGIPPAQSRLSLQRFFTNLGREIEFFYDRRILGFDSLDQVRIIETIRQTAAGVGRGLASWKDVLRSRELRPAAIVAGLVLLGVAAFLLILRASRRPRASAATRAYLLLRRLLAARAGSLSPAVPPFEVARLFGRAVPQGSGDARRVVSIYCASVFGGRALEPAEERELKERITRLKKLA